MAFGFLLLEDHSQASARPGLSSEGSSRGDLLWRMLAEFSSLRFEFRAMVPTWLLAGGHPQFLVRWGFPEELLPLAKCVSSGGWQESMVTGWEAPALGNQTVEGVSYRFWSRVPVTRKSSTPSHKQRGLRKTEYRKTILDCPPRGCKHTTPVLSSCPVAVIKHPNRSDLRETRFIWLLVQGRVHQGGRSLKQPGTLHPHQKTE